MSRQYPIWVDIQSCIYANNLQSKTGNKSYGVRNHSTQNIKVGTSRANSHDFAKVQLDHHFNENTGGHVYTLTVDGKTVKKAILAKGEEELEWEKGEVIPS